MIWPQRFGDFVLLVQPLPEVHHLAPLRAKRAIRAIKPLAPFLARRTCHRARHLFQSLNGLLHRSNKANRFDVSTWSGHETG